LCTEITYLKISMMAGLGECYNKLKGTQNAGHFFGQQINDKLHEEGSYV